MTTPRPIYDGSQYGCGYDEDRITLVRGRGPGVSVQSFYAYAGCMRTQPEMPKRMRSMRDATDNTVQASATTYRLSTRIPFPIHAIQSHRQHVNLVKSNGVQLHKSRWNPLDTGLTDRGLLPSQRQRIQDLSSSSPLINGKETALGRATTQVQPSSNPYYWEVPADSRSTSSWAKDVCARSEKIIQQQAGTLKRNTAVRRSRKERASSPVASTADVTSTKRSAFHRNHEPSEHKMRRSFSFDDERPCTNPSATWEQSEQTAASKPTSVTRVDSGIGQVTEGRSTRFREELDQPPRIARTFSEILGEDPFVPTALLNHE